jgi:hypothetical protein
MTTSTLLLIHAAVAVIVVVLLIKNPLRVVYPVNPRNTTQQMLLTEPIVTKFLNNVTDPVKLPANQIYSYALGDGSVWSTLDVNVGAYDDLCKAMGRVNVNGTCV